MNGVGTRRIVFCVRGILFCFLLCCCAAAGLGSGAITACYVGYGSAAVMTVVFGLIFGTANSGPLFSFVFVPYRMPCMIFGGLIYDSKINKIC